MTENDTTTSRRVFRGGYWNYTVAARVRARVRFRSVPSYRNVNLGVRCVLRGRQPR